MANENIRRILPLRNTLANETDADINKKEQTNTEEPLMRLIRRRSNVSWGRVRRLMAIIIRLTLQCREEEQHYEGDEYDGYGEEDDEYEYGDGKEDDS